MPCLLIDAKARNVLRSSKVTRQAACSIARPELLLLLLLLQQTRLSFVHVAAARPCNVHRR